MRCLCLLAATMMVSIGVIAHTDPLRTLTTAEAKNHIGERDGVRRRGEWPLLDVRSAADVLESR